jgi:hypothetical protein
VWLRTVGLFLGLPALLFLTGLVLGVQATSLGGGLHGFGVTGAATLMLLGGIAAYSGFIAAKPYFTAHIQNLVWQRTTLSTHRFECDLRFGMLLWIGVSNLVLTILTLGLFRPFGMVRMARYRVAAITLIPGESLDDFIGERVRDVEAFGDELLRTSSTSTSRCEHRATGCLRLPRRRHERPSVRHAARRGRSRDRRGRRRAATRTARPRPRVRTHGQCAAPRELPGRRALRGARSRCARRAARRDGLPRIRRRPRAITVAVRRGCRGGVRRSPRRRVLLPAALGRADRGRPHPAERRRIAVARRPRHARQAAGARAVEAPPPHAARGARHALQPDGPAGRRAGAARDRIPRESAHRCERLRAARPGPSS